MKSHKNSIPLTVTNKVTRVERVTNLVRNSCRVYAPNGFERNSGPTSWDRVVLYPGILEGKRGRWVTSTLGAILDGEPSELPVVVEAWPSLVDRGG